jgi:homoserine kinase
MEAVIVRVPATVANLGPGFDCMGLALSWHNEVRVERSEMLFIGAVGPEAERLPTDATNLVARALASVLGEEPRVRINQLIAFPQGRGLGSSAAAIVAGLVAGRALGDGAHSDEDLFGLAVALEGHADNVAPCLLGGITVIGPGGWVRIPPSKDLQVLMCMSPSPMATEAARAALPDVVDRADAVANLARASLLAAALATGKNEALLEATDDDLHQPARFALMPDSGMLVRSLRGKGLAAFLAGAGPSVAAFVTADAAEDSAGVARNAAPEGWEVRVVAIDADGATVVGTR